MAEASNTGRTADSSSSSAAPKNDDPRVYLAAERTFLAWIRTGLALMGFGFVVARFGIFLREIDIAVAAASQPHVFSVWTGTALVLIGVIVNLLAARNHVHFIKQLNQGITRFDRPSGLAISVSLILAVVGLAMAGYLAFIR